MVGRALSNTNFSLWETVGIGLFRNVVTEFAAVRARFFNLTAASIPVTVAESHNLRTHVRIIDSILVAIDITISRRVAFHIIVGLVNLFALSSVVDR